MKLDIEFLTRSSSTHLMCCTIGPTAAPEVPMHEYGIAQEMVTLALGQVPLDQTGRITQFTIEMSRAADESEDSLRFYLGELTRGTCAEGAAFDIQRVPLRARCPDCRREFEVADLAEPCPSCHSARVIPDLSAEFKLSSIEIE